ncbi:hypothetical protein FGIG_11161 [Fasciola gigantica]|uniref:Trematode PH-like domain-containing protein n=1 Tax=Fasciola gigantica TaxID=46835 RepID=A0A504Z019_FASGI|nr:hypothetical protein FGIG_11161 [Fasciola gigantica]
MSALIRQAPYFEDSVQLTGMKICNKVDDEVRENAASLMLKAEHNHDLSTHTLMCLYDTLVFSPPIHIENQYHRSKIPYKEIVGFYLASNYKNRLILVTQESDSRKVYLYGLQMSSATKTQEISSLLGDARSSNKVNSSKRERTTTVIVMPSESGITSQRVLNIERSLEKPTQSSVFETQKSGKSFQIDQRHFQNGYGNGYSHKDSKSRRRYSGIISNDIERDWDVIRGSSSLYDADDTDDQISIGYYNDEAELMEHTRIHNRDDDPSKDNVKPQNAWIENITYISNHPENGSQRSSSGSIYMYVAQQVNSRMENQIAL